MAAEIGMTQSAITRIWRAFALQPHQTTTFKLSKDPLFVEKVRDIVGLYLSPPDRALVLCVDEKTQIQALDRTQPLLPMCPGRIESRTHDYVRHGTTSLFAALDVKTGRVIGECRRRHRASEFKDFLKKIDVSVPEDLDVHLILDNSSTHKTPAIHRWLVKRPRYHLHFTPTSSSWINLVERWFAALSAKQIKRGTHRSSRQLETAIRDYIEINNETPKPFVWTKTADEIFARVKSTMPTMSLATVYNCLEALVQGGRNAGEQQGGARHQDRAEEQEARGNPHHVMLDDRPVGMVRREPRRQRKRDEHKHDEPRVMDTDVDPSNFREFH